MWTKERMPTVSNIEIEGRHDQADGFLLQGCMQPTFASVLLRRLHNGIRLKGRNRNVMINGCHLYHLTGVGIFLQETNLHQAIIADSHISYCTQGGIKIIGSEVRNLQITGNDIEYNYDRQAQDICDVLIDCQDGKSTVREGTIASNTIQSRYSPGGANIRIIGPDAQRSYLTGMWTISGNLIGSQETNVHLVACQAVTVSGNVIYSGFQRNLQVESAKGIVVGPNSFDHNLGYAPNELCPGLRFVDSSDISVTGSMIRDCQARGHTYREAVELGVRQDRSGLLELIRCQRANITGCHLLDAQPYGLFVEDSSLVNVTGCTILESRQPEQAIAAARLTGSGSANLLTACTLSSGQSGPIVAEPSAGLTVGTNLTAPKG